MVQYMIQRRNCRLLRGGVGGVSGGSFWIVDAISFQKICGSYSPIHNTKEKRKIGGVGGVGGFGVGEWMVGAIG